MLAGLGGRWELLAALRREADVEAMAIVVHQAAALGEAWRALLAPPPAQPLRPPLIILADASRTREVTLVDGLRHLPLSLYAPLEKIVEAAAPKEDPYEVIRRQAQRDAERALWRVEAVELRIPQINRPEPAKVAAAPKVEPAKVEAPKVEPPKVEAAPPKVEAAPPKVEAAPPPTDDKPKKVKRSRKAMEHFGPDPRRAARARPWLPRRACRARRCACRIRRALPRSAAPAARARRGRAHFRRRRICRRCPDKPTADEVALVARTSPNPQQRLELLNALKGAKTHPVVQALRDNVKSEHPAVRAAAEEGMANLFDANWNRMRAVGKPVQPPGSDDKNRPW